MMGDGSYVLSILRGHSGGDLNGERCAIRENGHRIGTGGRLEDGGQSDSAFRSGPGAGSTTVEIAIILPALMVVVLVAVQLCLWAFADEAVQSVASHAAVVSAGLGGTVESGRQAGQSAAAQLVGPVVTDPTVAVVPLAGGQVQATATGSVESILPWWHLTVNAVRTSVVQKFRAGP